MSGSKSKPTSTSVISCPRSLGFMWVYMHVYAYVFVIPIKVCIVPESLFPLNNRSSCF